MEQKTIPVTVTCVENSEDRKKIVFTEKDDVIARAIIANMSEEMKDHYYTILKSHDKGVNSFRNGTFITHPAIQINFIETGRVILEKECQ